MAKRPARGRGGPRILEIPRREMTPNQLASYLLGKELEYYAQVTKPARLQYKENFIRMEQLRYMNMKYFAAAIVLRESMPSTQLSTAVFSPENQSWQAVRTRLFDSSKRSPEASDIKDRIQLITYIAKIIAFQPDESIDADPGLEDVPVAEPPPPPGELTSATAEDDELGFY